MNTEIKIISEGTPNPNALKFVLDRTLIEYGSANFQNKEKADKSPLAKRLFLIDGVEEVLFGKNFITITKNETSFWEALYNKIVEEIENHFKSGDPVLLAPIEEKRSVSGNETEEKIKEILDSQIRPAVAGDGGDVIFDSFEDGILKLHLQGACSSCPSSVMTLKHGIEQMLKRQIPEIKEVISV